jgi:predicted membrane protein
VSDQQNRTIGRGAYCGRGPSRWLPGAILIGIGTLILLDHMNVIHGELIWKYWPVLLILLGIAKFVNESKRVGGLLLVLMGGFLMAEKLGYTTLTWATIWPLLIIAAGIAMIWGRFDLPRIPREVSGGANSISEYALFGGVERRVHMNNFKGGSITAVFGGVEVDFRSADIEGEEAVVFIEAVFGGIEVTVPDRWTVHWEGQNIFGGYSDETRPPLPDVPGAPPKKQLILRGRAVFGGLVVKN